MSLALLLGSLGGGPDGGTPIVPVVEHGPMQVVMLDGPVVPIGLLGTSEFHYIPQDTE